MSQFYTGIGSRETPAEIMRDMFRIAAVLSEKKYCLRSGKAAGADTAFQLGMQSVNGASQIFVPWWGFGKNIMHNSLCNQLDHTRDILVADFSQAEIIAANLHPCWSRLSQGAKKLHTRNVFQILGHDCNTPSKFVLFYALERNGIVQGGTATAVKLARMNSIPTINMLHHDWHDKLKELI